MNKQTAEQKKIGISIAAKFLTTKGFEEVGRNVRPCKIDPRCEIDLVMMDKENNCAVFIDARFHPGKRPEGHLWSIDRRAKNVLLRACTNWILRNRWHGAFRFDVVEVFGNDGDEHFEIDHIENVAFFPPKWKFW